MNSGDNKRNGNKAETAIYIAHDDFVGRDPVEAERNLMRAILQCAMEDIRKGGEAHRDAKRFFFSADETYLYSFASICNHLKLCPRTIHAVIGMSGIYRINRDSRIKMEDQVSMNQEKQSA